MSEFQLADDPGARVLSRLRGRVSATAAPLIIAIVFLLLSACSDSTPQAPESAQLDSTPVQPVSQPTPSGEQPEEQPVERSSEQPEETGIAEDNHADADHTIKFTDSNLDIWPPQPVDITEVAAITGISVSTKSQKILHTFKADTTIAESMSPRHEIPTQRNIRYKTGRDKYSNTSRVNSEIFDYQKNQVLTIEFDTSAKTAKIISQSINETQEYQPPESPAEVAWAIELASASLSKQGFNQHTTLIGTGLLAYPSTAESVASGVNFFKQRKIYVTFGVGNGELPLYRALVNLSTSSVESSGSIQ